MNKFKFLSILLLTSNLAIAKPANLTPEEIDLIQRYTDKKWIIIPKGIHKALKTIVPELSLNIGEEDLVLKAVNDLIAAKQLPEKTINQLNRYKTRIETGKVSIKLEDLTTRDNSEQTPEEMPVQAAFEPELTISETTEKDTTIANENITTAITEQIEQTEVTVVTEPIAVNQDSAINNATTEIAVVENPVDVSAEQATETTQTEVTANDTTSAIIVNNSETVVITTEVIDNAADNSLVTVVTDSVTSEATVNTEISAQTDTPKDVPSEALADVEENPGFLERFLNWLESKI